MNVEAEKRITEIRERESKATKGPWTKWVEHPTVFCENNGTNSSFEMSGSQICECEPDDLPDLGGDEEENEEIYAEQAECNAEFIAHARLDIPFLLEQISLLRRHIASPAQQEKRDEWVSVDERLPLADDPSEYVLVCWKKEWRGRKLSKVDEDTSVASPSGEAVPEQNPQVIQKECDDCGGYGHIEVTHDMAVDAGNLSLSGQLIKCGACAGDGWILVEAQPVVSTADQGLVAVKTDYGKEGSATMYVPVAPESYKPAEGPESLSYEQEIHSLLCAAASNTENLLEYFQIQAANEKGEAKKLTHKCIAWKREQLHRIREIIPKALAAKNKPKE